MTVASLFIASLAEVSRAVAYLDLKALIIDA